jgi:hypothetical protein
MFDLRVITAKALLSVNTVAPIRGFFPPSLMLIGQDLYKATEVEYNGVLASEWIVASPNRLVLRIPETQIGQPFLGIRVFADISLAHSKAIVEFGIVSPLKKISGIDRLVQAWLLVFFTTPGSDAFDQSSGGGGRSLVGKSTDRYHRGVAADLALCIDRTKNELLRLQAQTPGVPPEEKLLSSDLIGVSFDERTSMLYASVSLKNMVGDAAQLALG